MEEEHGDVAGGGPAALKVGVISDTHGVLRPGAAAALAGCDRIVHAGDVGNAAVLEELRRLAPVSAVRGNVDTDGPVAALPETLRLDLAGHRVLVIHDLGRLRFEPRAGDVEAVISGHTHRAAVTRGEDGIWYLNPGSAGPRRFQLPVTLAILAVSPGGLDARLVTLDV